MFVHLAGVDTAGHDFGWVSAEQIAAIERADEAVGVLDKTWMSRVTLRPRVTFSRNGITSSGCSGPPKLTRRKRKLKPTVRG